MLDIENGIRSLTEFKQNSSDVLSYIKKTSNPAILTVNGKAAAVLLDPKTYQDMANKLSYIQSVKYIEQTLIEMENDKGIPAKEVFKKLRQEFVPNEEI